MCRRSDGIQICAGNTNLPGLIAASFATLQNRRIEDRADFVQPTYKCVPSSYR